jgi:hypothetical protein
MSKNEVPKIAEKVRFWEEQDKINQAIIPRIVEMHEVIRELHLSTSSISSQIAAAEARTLKHAREGFAEEVAGVAGELKRLSDTVQTVQSNLVEMRAVASRQSSQPSTNDQVARAQLISYASGGIAMIALAMSLFSLIG